MSIYILISIAYEINTFSASNAWRTVSLIFIVWLIFCFIVMIILIFYLSILNTEVPNDYYVAFEEFFRGIKPEIESRLYVFIQQIRKVYFVVILVIYPSIDTWTLILLLVIYQVVYLIFIIYLRPFVVIKGNIIEFINESILLSLLITHFFIKSEYDWNTSNTNMYISVIVGNIIIIFVIISFDLLRKFV